MTSSRDNADVNPLLVSEVALGVPPTANLAGNEEV
jgi:hypothetical protein